MIGVFSSVVSQKQLSRKFVKFFSLRFEDKCKMTDEIREDRSPSPSRSPKWKRILRFNVPDQALREKIKNYVLGNRIIGHPSHEEHLNDLAEKYDYDLLNALMKDRLKFGTAGIRGKVGVGFSSMNNVVVVQTTQGIADLLHKKYILHSCSVEDAHKVAVVIGYDNRHNSKEFAELAACVFLKRGFKVYLFSSIVPTPFVPFSVRKLNCVLGIIITASHNPKEDNGYKVCGPNGAQILPHFAEAIQDSILHNLEISSEGFDKNRMWISPHVHDPLADMDHLYFQELINSVNVKCISHCQAGIVITSLHGVGHTYLKKALQKVHFYNFYPVEDQMKPDGDFPTVKFPNPEEKDCLCLAISNADSLGCTLVLANDPDADRLAVAEKLHDGTWHIYTGNEIGALLGSWLWQKCPPEKKTIPKNCFMISSTVSSKILHSIAKEEGFTFYETLTGFKFMANKAYDQESSGMNFLFAFEEAIGYMCSSNVMDKDGIQAAIQIVEMLAYAKREQKLLHDLLRETYLKYGYHFNLNSYFISHEQDKIKQMFNSLRNWKGQACSYPTHLELPKDQGDITFNFEVANIRDLLTGYDSRQRDKKSVLPACSTEMITFYFRNGAELTLRTSGTEPKVKYYSEAVLRGPESEWKLCRDMLKFLVKLMIQQWMKPRKYNFIPRFEDESD